jgi:hypothetical protein
MSDNTNYGFGKLVPGFDFLQNLAKGASQALPHMPNLANWVAPTLNVEELEKRIGELKAVHFWLDQNSKALGATIQALEVQRMTLATLQGMNFEMGEVANALKMGVEKSAAGKSPAPAPAPAPAAAQPQSADSGTRKRAVAGKSAPKAAAGSAPPGLVDPLQWWGALTQQFQQIAASAMKDAGAHGAPQAAPSSKKTAANAAASGRAPAAHGARKTAARRKAKSSA